MRITLLAAVILSTTALFTTNTGAGPLDPPPGPITGTPKPLGELEPRIAINAINTPGSDVANFEITKPGSYYLTANLTGDFHTSVINISTSGVTIDLNGFTIDGSALAKFGVSANGPYTTVRNGNVVGCVTSGVLAGAGHVRVSDVSVTGGVRGIVVGSPGIVEHCTADGCTTTMIDALSNAMIRDCVVSAGATGIRCTSSSIVTDCTVSLTTTIGISASSSCQVSRCNVSQSTGTGISVGAQTTIESCNVNVTSGDGIVSAGTTTIQSNTVTSQSSGTGSGVKITGQDTRVERNNIVKFAKGVDIAAIGSLIMGNSVTGASTAYAIVAGNRYGPIVDISAASGGAVNGSAAASNMTTTDPTANYTY